MSRAAVQWHAVVVAPGIPASVEGHARRGNGADDGDGGEGGKRDGWWWWWGGNQVGVTSGARAGAHPLPVDSGHR
eukprot:300571-Chlamydomonas_euryale.AAC.16